MLLLELLGELIVLLRLQLLKQIVSAVPVSGSFLAGFFLFCFVGFFLNHTHQPIKFMG